MLTTLPGDFLQQAVQHCALDADRHPPCALLDQSHIMRPGGATTQSWHFVFCYLQVRRRRCCRCRVAIWRPSCPGCWCSPRLQTACRSAVDDNCPSIACPSLRDARSRILATFQVDCSVLHSAAAVSLSAALVLCVLRYCRRAIMRQRGRRPLSTGSTSTASWTLPGHPS